MPAPALIDENTDTPPAKQPLPKGCARVTTSGSSRRRVWLVCKLLQAPCGQPGDVGGLKLGQGLCIAGVAGHDLGVLSGCQIVIFLHFDSVI
ncbi:MAG: hypothetical protein HGB01_04660 [Chlorobiaceae bacterium]|nr:hypothetical protein [Chlorobiaceae bacterium]